MDGMGPYLIEEEYPEVFLAGDAAGKVEIKSLENLPELRIKPGSILVHGPDMDCNLRNGLSSPRVGEKMKMRQSKTKERRKPASQEHPKKGRVTWVKQTEEEKGQRSRKALKPDPETGRELPKVVATLKPDGEISPGLPFSEDRTAVYRYGDFVAYWSGCKSDKNSARSWYVGQVLDQDKAEPGEIQLRGMIPYGRTMDTHAPWHYVWETSNAKSKAVSAPIGHGPLEKPSSPKHTSGDLSPEWIFIEATDVIMGIHLAKGQWITMESWEKLISQVDPQNMAKEYFGQFKSRRKRN